MNNPEFSDFASVAARFNVKPPLLSTEQQAIMSAKPTPVEKAGEKGESITTMIPEKVLSEDAQDAREVVAAAIRNLRHPDRINDAGRMQLYLKAKQRSGQEFKEGEDGYGFLVDQLVTGELMPEDELSKNLIEVFASNEDERENFLESVATYAGDLSKDIAPKWRNNWQKWVENLRRQGDARPNPALSEYIGPIDSDKTYRNLADNIATEQDVVEQKPEGSELQDKLEELKNTIRKSFKDISPEVITGKLTRISSMDEIFSSMGLNGDLKWRFKDETKSAIEGIDNQGQVIVHSKGLEFSPEGKITTLSLWKLHDRAPVGQLRYKHTEHRSRTVHDFSTPPKGSLSLPEITRTYQVKDSMASLAYSRHEDNENYGILFSKEWHEEIK